MQGTRVLAAAVLAAVLLVFGDLAGADRHARRGHGVALAAPQPRQLSGVEDRVRPRAPHEPIQLQLPRPEVVSGAPVAATARSGTTSPVAITPGDGDVEPVTTKRLRRLTLAAVGDILVHRPVIASAQAYAGGGGYVFDPMFDEVREAISAADLAICHQETPISADDSDLSRSGTLSFNAPRQIASALRNAGFRACDTASNHTWDRGLAGVEQTLDVLDQAGIGHKGSARNADEAAHPPIYEVNGVKIGHLAFSYTIYNEAGPNTKAPPEAPWLASMLWPLQGAQGILAQAHSVKERGAEFVVISMHWGSEYVHEPSAEQRQLARDLLASPDVDLILGHHAHVVQPCEKIGNEYVSYGMGNFLSNQSPTQEPTLRVDTQDGSIVTYTIEEVAPGRLETTQMTYVPTWVVIPGHKVVQATPDRHADSYNRTVTNMNRLGADACDAQPAF
ncbi:MAG: CapA family protein [Actinobacteria bacterium]|nr:CapA family protein [Actinomycetota bacterium]